MYRVTIKAPEIIAVTEFNTEKEAMARLSKFYIASTREATLFSQVDRTRYTYKVGEYCGKIEYIDDHPFRTYLITQLFGFLTVACALSVILTMCASVETEEPWWLLISIILMPITFMLGTVYSRRLAKVGKIQ